MKNIECRFCRNIFNNSTSIEISEYLKEPINRILFQDNDFAVISGLGPLVEGYVLIIPKSHIKSFYQLDIRLRFKYLKLKYFVTEVLKIEYSEPVFYEHGSIMNNQCAGNSIEHAHIHVLPVRINLIPTLASTFELVKLLSSSELWNLTVSTNYLYFEYDSNNISILLNSDDLPSQYLRKQMADQLNISQEWDWRKFVGEDKVRKTTQRLLPYFKNLTNDSFK